MKHLVQYIIVIFLLGVYVSKAVCLTVYSLHKVAQNEFALKGGGEAEEDKAKGNTAGVELETKDIYLHYFINLFVTEVSFAPTQKALRDINLHYKSVVNSPTTPPPKNV